MPRHVIDPPIMGLPTKPLQLEQSHGTCAP